ncbi:MAG: zinc-dependent metalloprotease family protein [Candidatus Eisenbacteria bacterium]
MRIPSPLTSRTCRASVAAAFSVVCAGSVLAAPAFVRVDESAITHKGARLNAPEMFQTVQFDLTELNKQLLHAPLARTNSRAEAPIVDLPMPDGSTVQFRVYESPVMAPELQAKYPEIRTYEGYGLTDDADFCRFSLTEFGFHGLIFTPTGSVWIDPYQTGDLETCSVFYKADYRRADGSFEQALGCELHSEPEALAEAEASALSSGYSRGSTSTGPSLHTYRTVVAATGEYTQFHGGTVSAGMAAIVVAMNRVNGVYQRDVSVFMELVPNNDLVVYTNGATDPYTNNNGGTMLTQNQNNLNAVIGNANFDIGHVFSTGGGGIASLGCVCVSTRKAQGVTGLPSPIGDTFYIDYVAHEMGHQFGATHSFNGTAGSCGGKPTASTAYEPGSGLTIMAYAGICGSHNIQTHSDDYFRQHQLRADPCVHRDGQRKQLRRRNRHGQRRPERESGPRRGLHHPAGHGVRAHRFRDGPERRRPQLLLGRDGSRCGRRLADPDRQRSGLPLLGPGDRAEPDHPADLEPREQHHAFGRGARRVRPQLSVPSHLP